MPFDKSHSTPAPSMSSTPAASTGASASAATAALPAADAGQPAPMPRPSSLPIRNVCRIVGHMTGEMVALVGVRVQLRADRRRTLCHVRQIAMYVCHVALQIPLQEIGLAFGRDRTTVGHACNVVEDRRDDPAFDDFVGAVERIVTTVFSAQELARHD